MTNRGIFSSILTSDIYKYSAKRWNVELDQSQLYWYDLLSNPPENIETHRFIVDELRRKKEVMEACLEKRFVYFICSRPKVRVDEKWRPSIFNRAKYLIVPLLVGGRKVQISLSVPNGSERPKLMCWDYRFVSLHFVKQKKIVTRPVHDFLIDVSANLGFDTQVHYVGYTKNPETRPTNGAHTGLSDVLSRVCPKDRDVFLIFNTFKVYCETLDEHAPIHFALANSMTDEIDAETEGNILEKSFIFYFDSPEQWRNKVKERGELKNKLALIGTENKIESVKISYEVDNASEYWHLGSGKRDSLPAHSFTVRLADGNVELSED